VQVFAEMLQDDDVHGITALMVCLNKYDGVDRDKVREAAKSALCNHKDNPLLLDEIVQEIRQTRQSHMLELLADAAPKNDPVAISALSECLADWDDSLRSVAIDSLCKVAQDGGAEVMLRVCKLLTHQQHFARQAAVEVLARVVPTGNKDAIIALIDVLDHEDDRVRRAAVQAMEAVTRRGDNNLTSALAMRLECNRDSVRRSAARALVQLTPKNDPHAIALMRKCLSNKNQSIQRLAQDVLLQIVNEDSNVQGMAGSQTRWQGLNALSPLASSSTNLKSSKALTADVARREYNTLRSCGQQLLRRSSY